MYREISGRIYPQEDVCIDIFATKFDILVSKSSFDWIVYLVRADSHIPIVANLTAKVPDKFVAICSQSIITQKLRNAGVIPVEVQ